MTPSLPACSARLTIVWKKTHRSIRTRASKKKEKKEIDEHEGHKPVSSSGNASSTCPDSEHESGSTLVPAPASGHTHFESKTKVLQIEVSNSVWYLSDERENNRTWASDLHVCEDVLFLFSLMCRRQERKQSIQRKIECARYNNHLNPHDSLRLNKVRHVCCIVNTSPLISKPGPMPWSSRNDDIIDGGFFIYGNRIRWDIELRDLTISLHYRKDVWMQLYFSNKRGWYKC